MVSVNPQSRFGRVKQHGARMHFGPEKFDQNNRRAIRLVGQDSGLSIR